jgi:Asp-tRNA(Asn)/Glu-tRNA(Gln) amidotransferase A subunit family amidase
MRFVREGDNQLPVGLQFLGKSLAETRLLGIADAYERASGWGNEMPPL